MIEEKHRGALQEVLDTIKAALDDPHGVLAHQRRVMAMVSLGMQHILEMYLHRKAILKPGAQIKHEWLKLSDQNLRLRFGQMLTKPWNEIPLLDEITPLSRQVELKRNDIMYGAPLNNDRELREAIDLFLEVKALIEKEVGALL